MPKNTITSEQEALYLALLNRDVPAEMEKWEGYKHIDIAIPEVKVNIEVDGGHHNTSKRHALSDLKRTYHSHKKGYATIRIPNCLTRDKKTIEETAEYIVKLLNHNFDKMKEEEKKIMYKGSVSKIFVELKNKGHIGQKKKPKRSNCVDCSKSTVKGRERCLDCYYKYMEKKK
jgi:very-short-patch-repair endonuclease